MRADWLEAKTRQDGLSPLSLPLQPSVSKASTTTRFSDTNQLYSLTLLQTERWVPIPKLSSLSHPTSNVGHAQDGLEQTGSAPRVFLEVAKFGLRSADFPSHFWRRYCKFLLEFCFGKRNR